MEFARGFEIPFLYWGSLSTQYFGSEAIFLYMPAQLRIIGRIVGRDSQLQPRDRRLRWASGEIYTERYGCCLT